MTDWAALSPAERLEAIREHARRNLTERQIASATGAPSGVIRVVARRHGIIIRTENARKADEAMADIGASGGSNMWAVDEDRRRQMIARRASKGAAETLRALR